MRTCEHSAATGVVPALEKIVRAIRKRCPQARIMVRGDSGFGVEEIMAWCESQTEVYYCLGIGKHSGVLEKLRGALADARARHCLTGASTRVFTEFTYQAKTSRSRERRVIGKAEVMTNGDNPRFIVTNLPQDAFPEDSDRDRFTPAPLYEGLYRNFH